MHEVKRVLGSKRVLTAFLLIFCLNLLYFLYNNSNKGYSAGKYSKAYNNLLIEYGQAINQDSLDSLEEKSRMHFLAARLLYHRDIKKDQKAYEEWVGNYREYYPDIIDSVEALAEKSSYYELQANVDAIEVVKEQIDHLIKYPGMLSNIKAQAMLMTSISIFADKSSFAYRNIQSTVEDYAALDGIIPELGSDLAVNSFFKEDITDYLILIFLLLIALTFIDERRKGLWSIIHAGERGRLSLGLWRIALVFFASLISCLLMFGSKLLAAFMLYGGTEGLTRAAQSMPVFKELWIPMSIQQLLILYFMVKILGCFLIGLCLWLLLSAASHFNVAIAFLSIFLGAEYGFYTLIRDNSIFVLLKYINIFAYVEQRRFFQHYMNLNIFKYPLHAGSFLLVLTPVLIAVVATLALRIQCRKYPVSSPSFIEAKLDALRGWISSYIKSASLLLNEMYKVMIIQKGILVLVIFIAVLIKIYNPGFIFMDERERALEGYYNRLSGRVTTETLEGIEAKLDELQQEINQIIESPSYSEEDIGYGLYLASLYESLDVLKEVSSYAEALRLREQQEGIEAYLLAQNPYRSFLDIEAAVDSTNLLAVITLVFLVLLSAGIYPYEKQRGMLGLLRASGRGRGELHRSKVYCSMVNILLLWAISTLCQLYAVAAKIGPLTNLKAPVQNLIFMSEFPLKITILQYLLLFYALRLLMLLSVAFVALFISTFAKRIEQSIALATAIVVLPLVVSLAGKLDLGYLSMLKPIGVVDSLSAYSSIELVLPFSIMLLLGIASLYGYGHRINKYRA